MTRKDYVLIAKAIHDTLDDGEEAKPLKRLAHTLAYDLKRENSRFDYDRFMKAAGF